MVNDPTADYYETLHGLALEGDFAPKSPANFTTSAIGIRTDPPHVVADLTNIVKSARLKRTRSPIRTVSIAPCRTNFSNVRMLIPSSPAAFCLFIRIG